MNESRALIERLRRINNQYQYLELAVEDEALRKMKPGESILVRSVDDESGHERWDPYLREQWWPSGFTADGLLLVERPYIYPYYPQQEVSVLGPIGTPYRFRKSLRNVLLIAYDTAPLPLTIMIGQLLHNKVSVTLVLLGNAQNYQTEHLPAEIEILLGDANLNWTERVMTLGWADQIFVVVKQDDELARFGEIFRVVKDLRVDVPKNYIFGVFQPSLPCGVGACSACMLRVENALLPACTKGPMFDLTLLRLPS
jgi:dihydroorotate dehydrogenase B-like protein